MHRRAPRITASLVLAMSAGLAAAGCANNPTPHAAPAPNSAQPANLVAPESLEQGFVLLVTDKSGQADANNPIYLASNHGGWDPGKPALRLSPRSDSKWQIVVPKPDSTQPMEFKFTLGAWSRVERTADDQDINNRTLPKIDASRLAPGEMPVIEFTVESFRIPSPDQMQRMVVDPYRTLDVTGTVRRLEVAGGAGLAAGMTRDLLVWLPPGYDEPANHDRTYPVLYLHDGQNLFEQMPGVPGEWHADETAHQLIEQGEIEPIIIVGIPHGGPARMEEYVPFKMLPQDPAGIDHIAWLRAEVMPRVEAAFRVRTDRESTAIGGASLGAVISLYAASVHPEEFGMLLLESMPLIDAGDGPWRRSLEIMSVLPERVFVGVGTAETGSPERDLDYAAWSEQMVRAMQSAGLPEDALRHKIAPGAVHNEGAWADRLPDALRFLFPAD